ncbi:MAG: cation-transporting P-type ATPase [Deltaproteobacteria bacterium]|nr:cation-transporting P-type ATPase [Deltaproteobacteria bacterium]
MTARLLPTASAKKDSKAFCDLKAHESIDGILANTGSAIFHCLNEDVKEPLIALAVAQKGVPYVSAAHSRKTPGQKGIFSHIYKIIQPAHGRPEAKRIFFLIISPIKESGTHLQLLSNLEGLLLSKNFQSSILDAKTENEACLAVNRGLETAKSSFIPLEKNEVLLELGTSESGISDETAALRLKLAGPNTIKRAVRGTLLKDFLYNLFLNLFAVLLWVGGALAFLSGMAELGYAIFLVIVINAVFSFFQEYKAERAVEALEKLLPKKVRVIRGGAEKEIDAEKLVPGDLIILGEGDSVPADGRLIHADDMRVDNSALTGESKPVYKISDPLPTAHGFIWTEVPNLVFAGTAVLSGAGSMVVTATGMDTEIGKVASLTQAIKLEMSPLQKEMANVTRTVTFIAVTLGAAFFIFGRGIAGLTLTESFIFAIGIIVANVPEGLLPTVSLSLAMGVQRMAAKNAIVKKLSAVETLGSATVICTDKTGTLTTNQMCVTKIYAGNTLIDVTGSGYEPSGRFFMGNKPLDKDGIGSLGVERLLTGAALCNNAALRPPSAAVPYWTISGDPTEGALITAAQKAGISIDSLRQTLPRIAQFPFERIRKRMATVHEDNGKAVAYIKGAPVETLKFCTHISRGGSLTELTPEDRRDILTENDLMASRGLRVLAVAAKSVPLAKTYKIGETEQELCFLGLVAMIDPPRPEVKEAVAACRGAGIKIVVATGDYGLTAKAVADEIGLDHGIRIITGEELGGLGNAALKELLKNGSAIFARVAPKDKLRVVAALQENGEVVAVTGDGVNDAPALKKADIGIAMGLRGSDVAKESAEIILADDNFASIVDAVREGRAVYANIKKFVTYIFASNIPEIIPFIAFVIFKIPLPLTVMQILAVDLGTDLFPALALGVEPPEKGVMSQPPRPRDKRLLDRKTIMRAYLFLGPIEAALCLAGFFFAYWLRGWHFGEPLASSGAVYAAATTMSFAGIVASQVGNIFACRTERESVFKIFFKNRFVVFAIAMELAISLLLLYNPFFQRVFGFAPLTWKDWAFLSAFPAVMLAASEARKLYLRRFHSLKTY